MTATPSPSLTETTDERARRLKRITRVSSWLKWFVTVLIVLLVPFTAITIWIVLTPDVFELMPEDLMIEFGDLERSILEVPLLQRTGIIAVALWFFGLLIWLMWKLRELFEQFRRHDFYSVATLSLIVKIGWLLLALGISDILTDMIGSVLLTLDKPEGERSLALSLDGSQIFFLVFGPLSMVFGWVMREAALAYEENQQFV